MTTTRTPCLAALATACLLCMGLGSACTPPGPGQGGQDGLSGSTDTTAQPSASVEPTTALDEGDERRSRRSRFARRVFGPLHLPPMPLDPGEGPIEGRPQLLNSNGAPFEFYFTRAAYSGYGFRGYASWSIDYPKADRQFLLGVRRLVNHLDLYDYEHPILLDDPRLLDFPFLYAVEVGYMRLSDEEIKGLRRYLLSGGFLVIDDFWGSREWNNLRKELGRLLPEYEIVDVPLEHELFHSFYDIKKLVQVPNVGQGRDVGLGYPGARTWEQDGYVPAVKGVFDDDGRLMIVINWNCDLGDAWEWAEDPYYPLEFSTYAYQVGVNMIVYAMTH